MRRWKRKLNQMTANLFDVPQDVTLDLPRLTMIGNLQLYIENHKGVLHFSSELLKLSISSGSIEVSGQNLIIRAILPEEVLVEGLIRDIKYNSG